MSKDVYDMLFDRIPHKNKFIIEPKEIVDYILYLEDKIQELTNNWNELEKWCKNNLGYYGSDIGVIYKYVLDKMKEIKEGNNDPN